MKTKRIISKLEIKGPNLIKGINYDGLRSLGLAKDYSNRYFEEGIDELIVQDIVSSLYEIDPKYDVIKEICKNNFLPITVAGGIKNLDQIKKIFESGADKIAVNTHATINPKIIEKASCKYGSQSIIASIEIFSYNEDVNNKRVREIWIKNGKEKTNLNLRDWILKVQDLGAGEILINSIDKDGLAEGADIQLIDEVCSLSKIPIIYSGGIKDPEEAKAIFKNTNVDAISISTLFHYNYSKKLKQKVPHELHLKKDPSLDKGNYNFINFGYGDQKYFFGKPISIKEFKKRVFKKS